MTFVHAALQSGWLVPVLWLLCRRMPLLAPTIRTGLWWGACVQMLVAWLAAAAHCSFWDARRLTALWAVGVALRLLLLVAQFRRARCLVHASIVAPDCAATETVNGLAARLALRRSPTVRVSPRLKTPVFVGLWNPVLLIPAAALQASVSPELRMALAHELAHLRRRDLWFGLVPVLAQAMLFFHPFAWWAVREYVLSREEACDAEARHVTETAADEYGAMLLGYVAAARRSEQKTRSLSPQYHSLLRRLNAMRIPYEQPKQGPVGAFCSVCILGAVCVSALQMNGSSQMNGSGPAPTQVAAVPPAATGAYRVASISPPPPVQKHDVQIVPNKVKVLRHWSTARVRRIHMAHAVTPNRSAWTPPRPNGSQLAAALPKRHVIHVAVPTSRHGTITVAMAVAQKGSPSQAPKTIEVAWDTPPTPEAHSAVSPDLPQMQSDLQAFRQQMQELRRHLPSAVPLASLPDEDFAKQLHDEMHAQFGPQFRQQWKLYDSDLQAQLEAEMPAIRAEVEQARRDAAQAQMQARRSQRLAAVQAREEALKESRQAREQALQELQKELPRIQEELKKELQRPLQPIPPLAFDTNDLPF